MTLKLTTSFIAASAVFATPAFADVSAADVWSNQQSFYAAMGGTLNGELSADGTVSPVANFILPLGAGSFQVKMGSITLTENNDGSVEITYPSPLNLSVSGGIAGEGSFEASLVMTNGAYSSIATGVAGDIAYETNATDWQIEVVNVTTDGVEGSEFSVSGAMTFDELSNTSRVTEGNLIDYTVTSNVGKSLGEFEFVVDNVRSVTTQTAEAVTSTASASLPVGGSDLMNLSQALRNGLSFNVQSEGGGNTSSTIVTLNGEVMNSQEHTTGPQTATISFDENGFAMDADAEGFGMVMNQPLLFPAPVEFAMEAISMAYKLPVNASEETQDFRVATSLQGITMDDSIWGLFDPAGQLPRDPAQISFDITGLGTNGLDLLDFAALSTLAGPPPVQVDEVTIENLNIAAVGAEASAKGAMTFDWTDFQTFPGMPRPEGTVTINLNGANGLMDKLVAMGFLPEEELMMPRMMMGMFATPVGEDMLETVVEVNSEGHLLANGQRLQ